METAPLKSFATWARTALISEVTARVSAVLAPGSSERVEQARAIAALEKAVTVAGGGDKGRAAVADKVAYIWFNRVVALRFMDATGYTGIGVVSPQAGVEVGQPEVLAEAKRGVTDTEVVSQTTRTAVAGLLDGTRSSGDPQGEAYALLLADYCRHWNRAMPFMFEREGDFTELLIPANLLADDSVLNRSLEVLTEEVCEDVEVIGWLYQFYISERKDEVFAGFKKGKKAGADEIPAATQLFTPHWIVRYLVENSLGRLWMLNRPTSALVDQMDYYIAPVDEETDFLTITKPEELKVIDPACGSGHMLTYAFDLLYAIYEEEGYAPTAIPGLILANNLHGTEIDPRAGALAAFALTMKARAKQRTFFNNKIEPKICVIEPISFSASELDVLAGGVGDPAKDGVFWNQFEHADLLGSLIQPDRNEADRLARLLETVDDAGDMLKADTIERAHSVVKQADYLSRRYSVVVANPPYMGANSMGPELRAFGKAEYKRSKSDLFAMFVERSIQLADGHGYVAMITMQAWLFLSTYEVLRRAVLEAMTPVSLAHLGTRAFDTISGEVVSTTAFILAKDNNRTGRARFMRLGSFDSEATKSVEMLRQIRAGADEICSFDRTPAFFRELPGTPVAFWLDDALASAFGSDRDSRSSSGPRSACAPATMSGSFAAGTKSRSRRSDKGMKIACRPVRQGSSGSPYNKGGGLRRWYGNQDFVVDWFDDGRDIKQKLSTSTPSCLRTT